MVFIYTIQEFCCQKYLMSKTRSYIGTVISRENFLLLSVANLLSVEELFIYNISCMFSGLVIYCLFMQNVTPVNLTFCPLSLPKMPFLFQFISNFHCHLQASIVCSSAFGVVILA